MGLGGVGSGVGEVRVGLLNGCGAIIVEAPLSVDDSHQMRFPLMVSLPFLIDFYYHPLFKLMTYCFCGRVT